MYNFDSMMDKVQKKVAEKSTSNNKPQSFKLPMGDTIMRILPPWKDGDDRFYHYFGAHFVKSTERNDQGNFQIKSIALCARHALDQSCDICNAIEQAKPYAQNEDQAAALAESESRLRVLVNGLILNGAGGANGIEPQIVELPATVFEEIIKLMKQQWDYGQVDSLSLTAGVDFIISRSGGGMNTKYSVSVKPGQGTQVDASVMQNINDLDEFIAAYNIQTEISRGLDAIQNSIGLLSAPQQSVGQLANQNQQQAPVLSHETVSPASESGQQQAAVINQDIPETVTNSAAPENPPVNPPSQEQAATAPPNQQQQQQPALNEVANAVPQAAISESDIDELLEGLG